MLSMGFFFKTNVEKLKNNKDFSGLIRALKEPDNEIRLKASKALSESVGSADVIIPLLIKEIEQAPPTPLEYYWNYQQKTNGKSNQWFDGEVLQQRRLSNREIATIIEKIGPSSVPVLNRMLESRNEISRIWINALLAKFDPKNESAFQYLKKILGIKDKLDFIEAADALTFLGPDAQSAIPSLIQLPKEDPLFGWVVVPALEAIGELAVPALLQEISDGNNASDCFYEAALGGIRPVQPLVVEALGKKLHIPVETREHLLNLTVAVAALGTMGPDAKLALPDLENVFNYDLRPLGAVNFNGSCFGTNGKPLQMTPIDEVSYQMNVILALNFSTFYSKNGFGTVIDWVCNNGLSGSNPYGWLLSVLKSGGKDCGENLRWGSTFSPFSIALTAIGNISGKEITREYKKEKTQITENRRGFTLGFSD